MTWKKIVIFFVSIQNLYASHLPFKPHRNLILPRIPDDCPKELPKKTNLSILISYQQYSIPYPVASSSTVGALKTKFGKELDDKSIELRYHSKHLKRLTNYQDRLLRSKKKLSRQQETFKQQKIFLPFDDDTPITALFGGHWLLLACHGIVASKGK